jgi:ketosteroid isomerase-like protein
MRSMMDHSRLESLTREFLKAYESKDLQTISYKLAPDVVVRDWNLEVVGKELALREFAKNFQEASELSIQIKNLYASDFSVAAQVEIDVNGIEILRVVDILTFSESFEITSIVSYKGL